MQKHDVNWDDLRILLAAVQHGTYADAGRELGMNATTVARRIGALEEAVGVALVRAHSRGVFATAAGEELCATAGRVSDEVLDVERRLTGRDAKLVGRVRFTTVDLFAEFHLPDLTAFGQRYPGLALEVTCDNRLTNLTRREADVALRFTSKPALHLVGTQVVGLRYRLYASGRLLDRLGRDKPLTHYPWVAWDEKLGASEQETWRREHAAEAHVACRVESGSMLYACVRAGMGIAFLTRSIAETDPDMEPLTEDIGWEDPMWLLTHPDLRNTARIRAFMDFMGPRIRARHELKDSAPTASLPQVSLRRITS